MMRTQTQHLNERAHFIVFELLIITLMLLFYTSALENSFDVFYEIFGKIKAFLVYL